MECSSTRIPTINPELSIKIAGGANACAFPLAGDFGVVPLHAGGVGAHTAAMGNVRQRVEQQELHAKHRERRAPLRTARQRVGGGRRGATHVHRRVHVHDHCAAESESDASGEQHAAYALLDRIEPHRRRRLQRPVSARRERDKISFDLRLRWDLQRCPTNARVDAAERFSQLYERLTQDSLASRRVLLVCHLL